MRHHVMLLAVTGLICLMPQRASAQSPDPNTFYHLTTKFRGPGFALDVFSGGPKNNLTHLVPTGNKTGQFWRLTPAGGGFFRLTTKFRGGDECLDVYSAGSRNNQPHITACSKASGQLWTLRREGAWVRLTTKFRGPDMCLDIIPSGPDEGQPELRRCGNFSGQSWKLDEVKQAPVDEVAGTVSWKEPRHGDLRLDWCMTPAGRDCGKAVAQRLCLKRFHKTVVDFRRADVQGSTAYFGGGKPCQGRCAAFGSISCKDEIPRSARFANPQGPWVSEARDNNQKPPNYRVDVCRGVRPQLRQAGCRSLLQI